MAGPGSLLAARSSRGADIKALVFELVVLAAAAMAVLAILRVGFALRFWRRVRLAAFVYVGGIIFLALLELVFHVRL